MSQYKLIYFNGKGRAELTRYLFAQGGVDYEDARVTGEEFAAMKPNLPFGQLPVLEVDGVTIAQSSAIARLVAKRTGLAGKTDIDQAKVDMIMDGLHDAVKPMVETRFIKDAEQKAAAVKKYKEEGFVKNFGQLEKILCQNNGGDGFFVGDSVTVADLSFFNSCTWIGMFMEGGDYFEKMPKLKALEARVGALPKIAEWVEKRPVTNM